MMQAYEGYMENGQFFPMGQPIELPGRQRVILTVIDDVVPEKGKKWKGSLSALDAPLQISDFRVFSREEFHER